MIRLEGWDKTMELIDKKKNEILRYLGYSNQKLDQVTDEMIDESIREIDSLAKERYIYRRFTIKREEDILSLEEGNLNLYGEDIKKHLGQSKECILFAATLGHDVDTRIRYYEKISMTRAVILDACATATIEDICDRVCEEIDMDLSENDESITYRYSPGYGDLPIHMQSDFLNLLNAKKSIGLTASSHSILIPRKSVTAIMGIIKKGSVLEEVGCNNCSIYTTCKIRKGGGYCGRKR